MSKPTAGYSFLLEFNERAINKVVRALFEPGKGGVPVAFGHDDPGQPGLLSSRQTQTGRANFQRYLFEGLIGYDLKLYDPKVRLLTGRRQQVALGVGFDLSLLRQLKVFQTSNPLQIPLDPSVIDPDREYDLTYDSGLHPKDPPSLRGRLVIVLNLMSLPLGKGNRISLNATESNRNLVERIDLQQVDWPEQFEEFAELVGAQAISTILREEIKAIDLTPLFGVFDIFDVSLRPPIHLRLGDTATKPALSIGLHEWSLVSDGQPDNIGFQTASADAALQIDEGFLTLLIVQLQNTGTLPRRVGLSGKADPDGPILIHTVRMNLEQDAIKVEIKVEFDGVTDLFAKTRVLMLTDEQGEITVSLNDTFVHVRLSGILDSIMAVFNALTFHIVEALIAKLLGSLLEATVNRTVGKTLDEFLEGGKLGFALESPISNSSMQAKLSPIGLNIEPGRVLLLSNMSIQEV